VDFRAGRRFVALVMAYLPNFDGVPVLGRLCAQASCGTPRDAGFAWWRGKAGVPTRCRYADLRRPPMPGRTQIIIRVCLLFNYYTTAWRKFQAGVRVTTITVA